MRRPAATLIIALAVLLACLGSTALTHISVNAMGAPTENFTIPDPLEDAEHNEIKPPVNSILHSASSLPSGASPDLAAAIHGASAEGASITGDEQWYLDVDINMPGWLYIYEYFPIPGEDQGRWIAYKWQLDEPGLWRLGPFRPGENEPEGQHIYRLFFYGDGQWAAGISETQSGYLVYWKYVRGTQEPAQPATTPSSGQPAPSDNSLLKFITNPLFLLIAPSAIVIIVLLALYTRRRLRAPDYARPVAQQPLVELLEKPGAAPKAPAQGAARAVLELPSGLKIRLSDESEIIGRSRVARTLGLDELGLISKQHFKISFADGKAFIEDLDSANGTAVNASSIAGSEPVELNDGDVIEMAGKASLKFRSSL
ncbi:MAG: FHA domain-containing protein [Dehalococcoidia bacterium]